jgi:hypothetical protein
VSALTGTVEAGAAPVLHFREISTRVKLLALWRYLGFELLNGSRRFWEFYLCYLVRGKVIEWRLEVVKDLVGRSSPGNCCGS